MHRFARLVALGGTLAALLIGSTSGASAASPSSNVVGHVYVDNNSAITNSVAGFERHLDGTLTPISGSPFATGGAGTGRPLGSAGAIQFSADGRYVLAVDAASNEISILRIRHDGSLDLVDTVSSNGTTPVSLAVAGDLVYVANNGIGGSNYTGFTLNGGGHLRPIADSAYALPDDALPGHVLFSGDGRHLVGTRVGPAAGPSSIDSFSVGDDGRLTPAPGSPFAAQRIGPFGSAFRPTNPDQLYVSNAHDGPLAGSVSAYGVAVDGTLTPIGSSPFADNQTAPCWVEISHDGNFLFAINTGSSSISSYAINADGSLTLLGSVPFSGTGLRPFDARLDPSGAFLYVVDAGAAKVSAFAVSGGTLAELSSSPMAIPGGVAPFGIVVD